MLKYTTTLVTFSEIPDEITLCINISGCPIHCQDCHSKELWNDIGEDLTRSTLLRLIEENKGITCVCFMGGDSDIEYIKELIFLINETYKGSIKTAWYSGQDILHPIIMVELDYYKYGSYKKEFGPLNCKTTNQRLYKINKSNGYAEDITYKFWNVNKM